MISSINDIKCSAELYKVTEMDWCSLRINVQSFIFEFKNIFPLELSYFFLVLCVQVLIFLSPSRYTAERREYVCAHRPSEKPPPHRLRDNGDKKAIRKHEKIVVKAALVGPSASGHVPPASSGDDSEASRLWFCDAATPAWAQSYRWLLCSTASARRLIFYKEKKEQKVTHCLISLLL